MNAPSVDIKDMLEDYGDSSGFDLTYGSSLQIGVEPSEPADVVTLIDTGGASPDLDLDGNNGYQRPSVHIRVRNTDYIDAYNLAKRIKEALHGRANESWNGSFYTLIQATGEPFFLGQDDEGRSVFVLNISIQRR